MQHHNQYPGQIIMYGNNNMQPGMQIMAATAIVVGERFVVLQPTTLLLQENLVSYSGDDFTITDLYR